MNRSTTRFITRMKLQELRRQRTRLRDVYAQLALEAVPEETAARLRRLYAGLRDLQVAGQSLHPEVASLDLLRGEEDSGVLSPELSDLWRERLENEWATGRRRAECISLFGALLEEWTHPISHDSPFHFESKEAQLRLTAQAQTTLDSPPATLLAAFFDRFAREMDTLRAELAKKRETLIRPVEDEELQEILESLADNVYHASALRQEAQRARQDAILCKELADALTILLTHLEDWDWPAEGIPTRAVWTHNKWRLYLNEDMATACLLEVVGSRWISLWDGLRYNDQVFPDGVTPAQFLFGVDFPEDPRVWPEDTIAEPRDRYNAAGFSESRCPGEYRSVLYARAGLQHALRQVAISSDYENYATVNLDLRLTFAEIQLVRAAYPDLPLYLLKTDLKDCYGTLPHSALLTLARHLGWDEMWLGFLERFLSPPLKTANGPEQRMRQGVPLAHSLAHWLAELLLRVLEADLRLYARVRVIRRVDDITCLTPDASALSAAWERLQVFCTDTGLAVNGEKSGSVALGGERPTSLPDGLPHWGMVALTTAGDWQIHEETFQTHLAQSQRRLNAAGSLLDAIQGVNLDAQYLLNTLAPSINLGEGHRAAITQAVNRFHHDYFGNGQSLPQSILNQIQERFAQDIESSDAVPESWLFWPLTAGGLGLINLPLMLDQYRLSYREMSPLVAPTKREANWDNEMMNAWYTFYSDCLEAVTPVKPKSTPITEALLKDFIERGQEISGGKQKDLRAYWQWVLALYGPQILQRFGTFRFLITELVPLQLIRRQRLESFSQTSESSIETDVALPFGEDDI